MEDRNHSAEVALPKTWSRHVRSAIVHTVSLAQFSLTSAGMVPKYLITDHGRQFIAKDFKRWCRPHGIRQRLGAVGKYGGLAVIERFPSDP